MFRQGQNNQVVKNPDENVSLTFLPATEDMFHEILEMMEDFNAVYHYPFNIEVSRKNLKEFIHNDYIGRLWVMKTGDAVIGYIVLTFGFSFEYRGRDAFIDEFFIKEAFRNKGIGKKTMEFVEQKAKELGVNAIHLEVEKNNEKGNKLYIKQGYSGNSRMLLTKRINK